MLRAAKSDVRRAIALAIAPALGIAACSRSGWMAHKDAEPVAPARSESPDPSIPANASATQVDSRPTAAGTVLRIVPDGPEATDAEIRYALASIEWHGRNEMFWLPLNGAETTVQLEKTVPTSELLTIRFSILDKQSEVGRFVQGDWATRNLSSYDKGGERFEVCVPMERFKRIDVGANRLRPSS